MQKNKQQFTYKELKNDSALERITSLVCKEAIKSEEIKINVRKTGVNIDPSKLPNLGEKSVLKSHPDLDIKS